METDSNETNGNETDSVAQKGSMLNYNKNIPRCLWWILADQENSWLKLTRHP